MILLLVRSHGGVLQTEVVVVQLIVFAMADLGFPESIKGDTQSNIYSGCGEGIPV